MIVTFRVQCTLPLTLLPDRREMEGSIFFGRRAKVAVYKRFFWTTALPMEKGNIFLFWWTLASCRLRSPSISVHPSGTVLHPCPPIRHTPMNAFLVWRQKRAQNTLLDSRWTRHRSYKVLWARRAREPRGFFSPL